MQTKDKICAAVKSAVAAAMNDGALKFSDALPEVVLEVPPKKEFGDFATNFAMQSAKIFRTSPRKIAEEIKARINFDLFDKIEIAGAGFMNFYLKSDVIYRELKSIYDAGENFGLRQREPDRTFARRARTRRGGGFRYRQYSSRGGLQRRERILYQ